jgi:hypothetical protein
VRRRVGAPGQLVPFGRVPQRVAHHAWLDARGSGAGIQIENAVHVFREIQDDGDVAALAGQARPRSAR